MKPRQAFTLIELLFVVAVIAVLAAISVPNFLEAQTRSKLARTRGDQRALVAALKGYYADHLAYPRNSRSGRAFFAECARRGGAIPNTLPTPEDSDFSWVLPNPGYARLSGSSWSGEGLDESPGDRTEFFASGFALRAITTPVAYLDRVLPADTFGSARARPFVYVETGSLRETVPAAFRPFVPTRYILLSTGPYGDGTRQGSLRAGISRSQSAYPAYFPADPPQQAETTQSAKPPATSARYFPFTNTILNPVTGPFIAYDPTNGTASGGVIFLTGAQ